jgi:hypothetical protein
MRRAWGAVLAVALAGIGGCGTDSGREPAPVGDPATVTLAPAEAPLAAGLVVPLGTRLIGPVFPGIYDPAAPYVASIAVLQVDGDPFAAWDDLAGQAQAIGLPIAGSGTCLWTITSSDVLRANPTVPQQTPVSAARPDVADALDCTAAANGPITDGSGLRLTMRLWWHAAGAELHVQLHEGRVDDFVSAWPGTDPGPAPAAASAQLPQKDAPPSVDPGDPFGRENNCFESGYDRLTLPTGARLVGGGTTPGLGDFAAVLAVEDPESVLGELKDQLDEPDDSNGQYRLVKGQLADGTSVWSLDGYVEAGGGACSMSSSPDGTAVLVTTYGD